MLFCVVLCNIEGGEENCRETADKPAKENDWKSIQQKGLWLNKLAGVISIADMLIIRFWHHLQNTHGYQQTTV